MIILARSAGASLVRWAQIAAFLPTRSSWIDWSSTAFRSACHESLVLSDERFVDDVDPPTGLRDQHVVLAREVAEEGALGDAGRVRDVLDGDRRVPAFGEQRQRGLLDLARVALATLFSQFDPGAGAVLDRHPSQG